MCRSTECALEDELYEDGAETQVECNRCVCACGNWVCTAMTCSSKGLCPVCAHKDNWGGVHLAKRMPFDLFYVIFPDKQAAVDESADDGAEMTEEEWSLRVAELNKHQVCICTE